jgi:hypothetical protein
MNIFFVVDSRRTLSRSASLRRLYKAAEDTSPSVTSPSSTHVTTSVPLTSAVTAASPHDSQWRSLSVFVATRRRDPVPRTFKRDRFVNSKYHRSAESVSGDVAFLVESQVPCRRHLAVRSGRIGHATDESVRCITGVGLTAEIEE